MPGKEESIFVELSAVNSWTDESAKQRGRRVLEQPNIRRLQRAVFFAYANSSSAGSGAFSTPTSLPPAKYPPS